MASDPLALTINPELKAPFVVQTDRESAGLIRLVLARNRYD